MYFLVYTCLMYKGLNCQHWMSRRKETRVSLCEYMSLCVCVCMRMSVQISVEVRGQCQVSSSIFSTTYFEKKSLLLSLELTGWLDLLAYELQGASCRHISGGYVIAGYHPEYWESKHGPDA